MSSIFLAHSSKDKLFARRLAKDLRNRGVRVWIDEAEILVGDSLLDKLESGIRESKYLGVILSPSSVESSWVKREVEVALNEEIKGKRVKVIPILYKKCEVPLFLSGKVWADFSYRDKYARGLKALLNRLEINDAFELDFVEPWTPKALRIGLTCGMLVESRGEVVLSDRLLAELRRGGSEWAGGSLPIGSITLHFLWQGPPFAMGSRKFHCT